MRRVSTSTAAPNLHGVGKPGFTGGNAPAGIFPTEIGAEFCNGVQEELVGCIEAAGLTPSAANNKQLLKALPYCANVASDPDDDDVVFPLQSEAEPTLTGGTGYFRKTDTAATTSDAPVLMCFFSPPAPSQGSVEYKIQLSRRIFNGPHGTLIFRQAFRRLDDGSYSGTDPEETYNLDNIGMTYSLDFTAGKLALRITPKVGEDPDRDYRIVVVGEIMIIKQDLA